MAVGSFQVDKIINDLITKVSQRGAAILRARKRMKDSLVPNYRYLGRLTRTQALDVAWLEVLKEIKATGQRELTQIEYNLTLDEAMGRVNGNKS